MIRFCSSFWVFHSCLLNQSRDLVVGFHARYWYATTPLFLTMVALYVAMERTMSDLVNHQYCESVQISGTTKVRFLRDDRLSSLQHFVARSTITVVTWVDTMELTHSILHNFIGGMLPSSNIVKTQWFNSPQ